MHRVQPALPQSGERSPPLRRALLAVPMHGVQAVGQTERVGFPRQAAPHAGGVRLCLLWKGVHHKARARRTRGIAAHRTALPLHQVQRGLQNVLIVYAPSLRCRTTYLPRSWTPNSTELRGKSSPMSHGPRQRPRWSGPPAHSNKCRRISGGSRGRSLRR